MTGDPLWYKDAIIYELHVRAFADSDADGIGDFRGLTERLDYLQDLGVTAIWVLPFYPSPLKDDGYDIADFTAINPMYGDMQDIRTFIKEAHRRGLKVITELVCNHTSDQHPWFQRARRAPRGSPERDFYVWSDTPARYKETRIIFKDFEPSNWTFDHTAGQYYWHRFYHHQPDLNFDNPAVHRAIFQTLDFWMKMGVDGMRLDAIPYLYERDGTSNENLPETHAFLKKLRSYIDARYADRMLLSEANQWPEDVIQYFGDGDECHMNFHFPIMPRMYMALYQESRHPIIDILNQTPPIPESCQWALFLRNHDELTLEMVTDEERDYMYRAYAADPRARINLGIRRRLAPLLQNNRRRIELMNGLLCSLPGTPVIYYGDEIGMGDNIYLGDRNGVRTPMQWSPDRNAGFSQANRQQLYLPVITDPEYHFEAINVATQQRNPSSLLWWMKRLIALRKRYKAFGRGSIAFLHPENPRVLAFVRRYEEECILVVANLSRFVQGVELDLAEFRGLMPVELFGRVPFPPVADRPYFITLGPHEFFWFSLEPQRVGTLRAAPPDAEEPLPLVTTAGAWEAALAGRGAPALQAALARHLKAQPWFQGGGRDLRGVEVADAPPLPGGARLALVRVDYTQGDPETYAVPLAWAAGERAAQVRADSPRALIAELRAAAGEGLLFDAFYDVGVCRGMAARSQESAVRSQDAGGARRGRGRPADGVIDVSDVRPTYHEGENTTAIFGDRMVLKLFRKVAPGVHPELELARALAGAGFPHAPRPIGTLEYRREQRDAPMVLAAAHAFVANIGDGWRYTVDTLGAYLEAVAVTGGADEGRRAKDQGGSVVGPTPVSEANAPDLGTRGPATTDLPSSFLHRPSSNTDPYTQWLALLGRRLAEMHRVLARVEGPDFTPEAYTPFYQRSVYQGMRAVTSRSLAALRRGLGRLPEDDRPAAEELLAHEARLGELFQPMLARTFAATRSRVHGDFRLDHALVCGDDLSLFDFEGDPARSLSERRLKRSPLRDVAALLRSLDLAAAAALDTRESAGGVPREQDLALLRPAAAVWVREAGQVFLEAYVAAAEGDALIPEDAEQREDLLRCFLAERTLAELERDMSNRPERARAAIDGLLGMVAG